MVRYARKLMDQTDVSYFLCKIACKPKQTDRITFENASL